MEEMLTITQASDLTQIPTSTLRRYCQESQIKAYKDGNTWKIPKAEIAILHSLVRMDKFSDLEQREYIWKSVEELKMMTEKLNENVHFLLELVRSEKPVQNREYTKEGKKISDIMIEERMMDMAKQNREVFNAIKDYIYQELGTPDGGIVHIIQDMMYGLNGLECKLEKVPTREELKEGITIEAKKLKEEVARVEEIWSNTISLVQTQIEELSQRLQNTDKGFEQVMKEAGKQVSILSGLKAVIENALSSKFEEMKALKKELGRFFEQLQTYSSQLESYQKGMQIKFMNLEKRLDLTQTKLDSVQGKVESLEKKLDSFQTQVKLDSVESLEKKLDSFQTQVELDSVQGKVESLEKKVDSFQTQADSRDKKLDSVQGKYESKVNGISLTEEINARFLVQTQEIQKRKAFIQILILALVALL